MLTMLAEWARCIAQRGRPVLCPLQDGSELRHIGHEGQLALPDVVPAEIPGHDAPEGPELKA